MWPDRNHGSHNYVYLHEVGRKYHYLSNHSSWFCCDIVIFHKLYFSHLVLSSLYFHRSLLLFVCRPHPPTTSLTLFHPPRSLSSRVDLVLMGPRVILEHLGRTVNPGFPAHLAYLARSGTELVTSLNCCRFDIIVITHVWRMQSNSISSQCCYGSNTWQGLDWHYMGLGILQSHLFQQPVLGFVLF